MISFPFIPSNRTTTFCYARVVVFLSFFLFTILLFILHTHLPPTTLLFSFVVSNFMYNMQSLLEKPFWEGTTDKLSCKSLLTTPLTLIFPIFFLLYNSLLDGCAQQPNFCVVVHYMFTSLSKEANIYIYIYIYRHKHGLPSTIYSNKCRCNTTTKIDTGQSRSLYNWSL